MKVTFIILLIALSLSFEKIIHTNDFTTSDNFFSSTAKPEFVTYNGRKALKITNDKTPQGTHVVFYKYNLGNFAGKTIKVTCDIAAVNVTKPTYQWNGIKLSYAFTLNDISNYPGQTTVQYGTSDWKTTTFEIITYSIEKVSDGLFSFGMQDSAGTVYFSNLIIEEFDTTEPNWTIPEGFKCEYTDNVLKRNRARGVMSPKNYTDQDFDELKKWNVNLIRWQIVSYPGKNNNLTRYDEWITAKLDELENVMQKALDYDMYVVIDIHAPPGGRLSNGCAMYFNKTFHDYYIELWKRIVKRFKHWPNIYAYDLINEPGYSENAYIHYLQSQYDVIKAIREIDDITPITVEFWPWPVYSYPHRKVRAFPFKDIIYQLHIYTPTFYTHQGVSGRKNNTGEYPGQILGVNYNKTRIEKDLEEVFAFSNQYGAKVYVGEFSAIIWGKGNEKYIEDVIKICEENKWDWSYHAFREWNGWSVEHEWINGKRVSNTPRKEVLLKYFALNEEATMIKK